MKFRTDKVRENKFQTRLVGMLEKRGAKVLNIHGHMMQKSGWPDLFISHWDFTGWIELKVEEREVKTHQKLVIKDLRLRGTVAFVLRYEHDDETLQLDEVPGLCWRAGDITKENVIETLNVMLAELKKLKSPEPKDSTDEDAEFERLLTEGEDNDGNFNI